jgi:myo-inositol 2-dehydrogenase / D-chiro-inositol 1-dehydrogenase
LNGVRIGLIGAGVMGRIHARCLSSYVANAQVAAVADLDHEKAQQCAHEFGVDATYNDHLELLADRSIDAVLICTPGNTHGTVIEAAARAGKRIFCEKPLDWDLAAADRALAAVEQAGVKLQIGFQRRFDRDFARVRAAVASGATGRPLIVHLVSRDPARPLADPKAPGDLYFDSTIHDLDMVRYLTGDEVEAVHSVGRPTAVDEGGEGEDPDTAVTLLRLAGGTVASIDNSRRSTMYDQRAELFGTGATVRVDNRPLEEPRDDADIPFFALRYWDSYVSELNAFVESMRSNGEPQVTGYDGRAALVLATAAFRSRVEGRPVAVSEIG